MVDAERVKEFVETAKEVERWARDQEGPVIDISPEVLGKVADMRRRVEKPVRDKAFHAVFHSCTSSTTSVVTDLQSGRLVIGRFGFGVRRWMKPGVASKKSGALREGHIDNILASSADVVAALQREKRFAVWAPRLAKFAELCPRCGSMEYWPQFELDVRGEMMGEYGVMKVESVACRFSSFVAVCVRASDMEIIVEPSMRLRMSSFAARAFVEVHKGEIVEKLVKVLEEEFGKVVRFKERMHAEFSPYLLAGAL